MDRRWARMSLFTWIAHRKHSIISYTIFSEIVVVHHRLRDLPCGVMINDIIVLNGIPHDLGFIVSSHPFYTQKNSSCEQNKSLELTI
jgi:hypothetical protein